MRQANMCLFFFLPLSRWNDMKKKKEKKMGKEKDLEHNLSLFKLLAHRDLSSCQRWVRGSRKEKAGAVYKLNSASFLHSTFIHTLKMEKLRNKELECLAQEHQAHPSRVVSVPMFPDHLPQSLGSPASSASKPVTELFCVPRVHWSLWKLSPNSEEPDINLTRVFKAPILLYLSIS